jgi:hypothetical protein
MIKKTIKVPLYDYKIILLEIESKEEKSSVLKICNHYNIDERVVEEISSNIENDCYNGGITCHNSSCRTIVVLLYRQTNEVVRRRVINHEKRHVEDFILQHLDIDDLEASAYLAGFLSEKIY